MTFVLLIDCENLTAPTEHRAAGRWRGADRIELFGRQALVGSWHHTLAGRGLAAAAVGIVADDAPSQAADRVMAARVDELIGLGRPGRLVIASDDKGFDADIARARAAGWRADRLGPAGPSDLLRLVVSELAGPDGWAGAGGVGDRLWRRFAIKAGRGLEHRARMAGLEIRRDRSGLALRLSPP